MLEIITYPHNILVAKSYPVHIVDDETQVLIDQMLETVKELNAFGLSAPQVGVLQRIIVVGDTAYINPTLFKPKGGYVDSLEGCLSLPGIQGTVKRAARVHVDAWNREGENVVFEASGKDSCIFQHEVDHLDGKLFVERLPYTEFQHVKKILRAML